MWHHKPEKLNGLWPSAGVVLVPTGALPLKLVRRAERAVIERALSAPAPLTRLIAVVSTSLPKLPHTQSLFIITPEAGVPDFSLHWLWFALSSSSPRGMA